MQDLINFYQEHKYLCKFVILPILILLPLYLALTLTIWKRGFRLWTFLFLNLFYTNFIIQIFSVRNIRMNLEHLYMILPQAALFMMVIIFDLVVRFRRFESNNFYKYFLYLPALIITYICIYLNFEFSDILLYILPLLALCIFKFEIKLVSNFDAALLLFLFFLNMDLSLRLIGNLYGYYYSLAFPEAMDVVTVVNNFHTRMSEYLFSYKQFPITPLHYQLLTGFNLLLGFEYHVLNSESEPIEYGPKYNFDNY